MNHIEALQSVYNALKLRPLSEQSSTRRLVIYLMAAVLVLIATLIRTMLTTALSVFSPTIIFVIPVAISAWYGGFGPGILAMVLGGASAIYFFIGPSGEFSLDMETWQLVTLLTFLLAGVIVSLLAGHLHSTLNRSARSFQEARDALEELGKTERRISSLVDNIIDGIISINEEGKIESWNQSARKMFGYDDHEVIGQKIELLIKSSKAYLRSGIPGPIGSLSEATGQRKDGSYFTLELSLSEFTLAGQVYFTAIVRDITERNRVANELILAKEAAEAASRAKSQFVANISHEIRTPLGVIIGFTDLLNSQAPHEGESRHYIETIARNARHLAALIDELLDLSKIEAGRIQIEKMEFSVQSLIEDVLSVLLIKAQRKGLRLIIQSDGPTAVNIHSDPARVRQILINVIGNAIKFTEEGEVEITVRSLLPKDEMAPIMMQFEVRDTGIGLSSEEQSRIFQPFEQADPTLARKFGGTGLGLVISRRFAQALGGDLIILNSQPGKGSTFRFTLLNGPKKNAILQVIPKEIYSSEEQWLKPKNEAQFSLQKNEVNDSTNRLKGVRVLLVEDSQDNRHMVTRFLNKAGAIVDTAINGRDGVIKAVKDNPDVILMDLQMPELDGYSATSDLRKRGYKRPIIALTAHAMREERSRALKAGFDEYLTKPVNKVDLVNTVKKLTEAEM